MVGIVQFVIAPSSVSQSMLLILKVVADTFLR